MIRGLDFYQHCHEILQASEQVDFWSTKLSGASFDKGTLTLLVEGARESMEMEAELVFNSITGLSGEYANAPGVLNLLQHFKGLIIETPEHHFDPTHANLMDFRTDQQHGTTFFYVLPLSTNRALVEYTLFSPSLLSTEQYDEALQAYITHTLGIKNYKIVEDEFGIIPMTNYRFQFYDHGLFNIGTAGGQTKGSSGYTFQFIQKRTTQIASLLTNSTNWSGIEKKLIAVGETPARFHFYDHVLLNVLHNHYLPGNQVFTRLFERNPAHKVFRFLDNETTFPEEVKIISSLPTWPFLKAAVKTF
jgi:lycopene beta-cyclase